MHAILKSTPPYKLVLQPRIVIPVKINKTPLDSITGMKCQRPAENYALKIQRRYVNMSQLVLSAP